MLLEFNLISIELGLSHNFDEDIRAVSFDLSASFYFQKDNGKSQNLYQHL
jgi:hypothetical protein